VKPQPKASAKAGKPAAKGKAAAKPVKAASKAAKPAAKKAVAKPVPKSAAKKAPAKAPAKKAPVKTVKAPAKAPAKKPAVAAKAKPAPAKAPAAKAVPAAKPVKPAPAAPQTARAMPPRPDAATLTAEPARATKPSARLAQITVPSMAQSVASTAAKASYVQTMSPSVLTPPPLVAIKKDPKLANNWKSKAPEELSDAEVMAMPDAEYMNEKQMAFFRLKLMQLKQDILNSAGETTEHLREDTVIVPDPADRATIEEEHALELRTRDRERKLLKKIEQSIARIDAGDYGYCDETGEPIGVGRLLARPTATLSLEAQQRRELKQKMFGD
jgi:DnaK suppressor protein